MSRAIKPAGERAQRMSAFFLVGVTACGKSAVAQFIAERRGYDVLSADSMLVYEGMDIGTAKPSRDERLRVSYHCIDIVAPDRSFSVWDFRQRAVEVLRENAATGRTTVVVGGSGLHVKSLTAGLRESPGADNEARRGWEGILARDGVGALQAVLKEKNRAVYESLADKANPRRLIRALETAGARGGGSGPGVTWGELSRVPLAGLRMERKALDARIRERVLAMFEGGFEQEVEDLLVRYGALSDSARQAIGYAEVLDLLDGRCSRDEAVERTVLRTRQLAKRQQTWFNRQANVEWIATGPGVSVTETVERVEAHWRRHGPVPVAAR